MKLIHEDYFAGIGGFALAAERLGITTARFIEIDTDAQTVLQANFPCVEIIPDIKEYHPTTGANLYTIGFPCTGTSDAGTRTGLTHQESALWFEALRCICEGQPDFIIIENPEGIIYRGLRAVLGGLRMAGYHWDDPQIISAAELGAAHQRKRVFICAHHQRIQWRAQPLRWSDQIRDMAKESRAKAKWLLFERSSNGVIARFPTGLDAQLNVPKGTHGRIRSRFLFGRTVTPPQASIPLMRIKYLSELIAQATTQAIA